MQQKALASQINASPRMAFKRKQLAAVGGAPIQAAKQDELQAKMPAGTTVQHAEEGARPNGARPNGARPNGARPNGARPNHTGMPDQLKSGIESLSGMSMDHVNVL